MNNFTIYGLFTKMLYDGDGRKTPEYTKDETKEKNSPFGCPLIPPSTKWRPTVFRCPKTPKTSRTYPKWELINISPHCGFYSYFKSVANFGHHCKNYVSGVRKNESQNTIVLLSLFYLKQYGRWGMCDTRLFSLS